jgi:hypothetical protein
MRKIGIVFLGVIYVAGFFALGIDLILLVCKLLLLILSPFELLIEGPVVTGLSLGGAAFAGLLVLIGGISLGTNSALRSKKIQGVKALLVLLVVGLLAGVLPVIPTNAPQVVIWSNGAQPTFLDIVSGTTIRLTNTSSTLRQILCTGSRSHCQATREAPAEFAPPGLVLLPGQTVEVTFAQVGDFHLISPVTEHMTLEVLVEEGGQNSPDLGPPAIP